MRGQTQEFLDFSLSRIFTVEVGVQVPAYLGSGISECNPLYECSKFISICVNSMSQSPCPTRDVASATAKPG